MANIGTLATIVTANTAPFERAMKRARSRMKSFGSTVRNTMRTVGRAMISIPGMVGIGGTGGLVGWAIKLAAELEQVTLQFEVMLGKDEDVEAFVQTLRRFADVTTFQQREVFEAARAMLTFGFAANEVTENLRMLGDISAGSAERLNRIVHVFGQVKAKGKADTRDLWQFADAGVDVMGALSASLHKNRAAILKMTEDGKISFAKLLAAMIPLTEEGGRFYQMLLRSSETTGGRFSTLRDNFVRLGTALGEALIEGLDLNRVIKDMTTQIEQAGPKWVRTIKEFVADSVDLFKAGQDIFVDLGGGYARFREKMAQVGAATGIEGTLEPGRRQVYREAYEEQQRRHRPAIPESELGFGPSGRRMIYNPELNRNKLHEMLLEQIRDAILELPKDGPPGVVEALP